MLEYIHRGMLDNNFLYMASSTTKLLCQHDKHHFVWQSCSGIVKKKKKKKKLSESLFLSFHSFSVSVTN